MFKCYLSAVVVLAACGTTMTQITSVATPSPAASASASSLTLLIQQLKSTSVDDWNAPADKDHASRQQLLAALSKLSDSELAQALDQVASGWPRGAKDLCLTEIIRRKGPYWEKSLTERFVGKSPTTAPQVPVHSSDSISTLTALRRLQGKSDPLMILVEGKAEIHCSIAEPLEIMANLTNLDSEKTPVQFVTGGDYRGAGRSNRWRLDVTDSDGHLLPEIQTPDMGGFFGGEHLAFGESLPNRIRVGSYVQIDHPGTYTMVALYHPEIEIGCTASDEGLICVRSIPIRITVDPVNIESSDAEQAKCAALIKKLPGKGAIKVVTGGYDPRTPDYFGNDTVEAQLAVMQWTAVPQLIRAANADGLNPTQRAWVLALLYTITDLNNPTQADGVLGPFNSRPNGWTALRLPDGKIITDESSSGDGKPIDEKLQREFAKLWKPWIEKNYIQITQSPPPATSASQSKVP